MIILSSGRTVDAMTVIKANGFFDTTPEISLMTQKVFCRDGKFYRFRGWNHLDENHCWQDIDMIEHSI